MRAIVTGGRGFLGSHIMQEMTRRGIQAYAPSHQQFDLLTASEVNRMLGTYAPIDVIVHAAAAVGGIGANVAEPGRFFHDNVEMGVHLLESARQAGIPKMVTIGTACMYPQFCPMPQKESDLWQGYPAPDTAPYALAKRAILEMGQAYRKQYGFNAVFLIPTNLYGPRDNFDLETGHVIPAMIRRFDEAEGEITMWGTGWPTRDFLYVEDAASGIVDAAERYDRPEPLNLGTGVDISIKMLAETIAVKTGFEGKILWDREQPDGQPYRRLDTTNAEKDLDWVAETSLEDGLDQTIAWYRRRR